MKVIRRWRRKRTAPTVTELIRVQQALERDPALRLLLGPRTMPVPMRTGEIADFSAEAVAVGQAMMASKLNPERAALRQVLAVAAQVLGLVRKPSSDITLPGE